MNKIKSLALMNVISLLLHIGTAYMVELRYFNENTVGEISGRYFSLFTPAGFTFSIWGIIYTCLGIFCVYHIIMAWKHDRVNPANADLVTIGGWFIFTNVITVAWLLAWTHNNMLLSVCLIWLQLISLIIIHQRLRIHNRMRAAGSKLATEFPLSIYLGWISVATIANTSIYLVAGGWQGGGLNPVYWTMIMIGAAIVIGMVVIFTRRNIAFGMVVMWALYGILSKLRSYNNSDYSNTINIAWAGIALLGLSCLIELGKGLSYKKPRGTNIEQVNLPSR